MMNQIQDLITIIFLIQILVSCISEEISKHGVDIVQEEGNYSKDLGESFHETLSIGVMTWNMAELSPAPEDVAFLKDFRDCDLVVLGVQETENIKPRREEGSRSREWRRLQIRKFGKRFSPIVMHAMGGLQLTVFARKDLAPDIPVVKVSEVACGIGNVLTNKGAICAFLDVGGQKFCFINAHMAAHHSKIAERNADYLRIMSEFSMDIPPEWRRNRDYEEQMHLKGRSTHDLLDEDHEYDENETELETDDDFGLDLDEDPSMNPEDQVQELLEIVDHHFFFGDLNYRTDLSREDMEEEILNSDGQLDPSMISKLLLYDQLNLERSHSRAFGGFSEGRIRFNPTFKYDKNSNEIDTSSKRRIPAWTDRILFTRPTSVEASSGVNVEIKEYRSIPSAKHSDHRPVIAKFSIQQIK